jgi:hypothetical protein
MGLLCLVDRTEKSVRISLKVKKAGTIFGTPCNLDNPSDVLGSRTLRITGFQIKNSKLLIKLFIQSQSQNQSYFTTGSLPQISSSWRQAPRDSRPVILFSN